MYSAQARARAQKLTFMPLGVGVWDMVVVRNRFASLRAGGPRQFAELRDIILVEAEPGEEEAAQSELDNFDLRSKVLNNAPVLIAEPRETLEGVLESFASDLSEVSDAVSEIDEAREQEEGVVESTAAIIRATEGLVEDIRSLSPIRSAGFAHSMADFGPENLRLAPNEMETVFATEEREETLRDVTDALNVSEAWEMTRGENASVAIFDTGYAEDLIPSSRIVGTFHGDMVDSVFAPAEGHGTMCAGAAAANSDDGVPFDGMAPDSSVYLVRTTDDEGQIRTDVITEAWDWIVDQTEDTPIVTNHSYGTPLCSTVRRPQFCQDATAGIINIANSDPFMTSCYAAGNEAMQCGHRPSGLTNGITAHNSLESIVTVGALLTDGQEAQRYSSHGRGDCAPRADPKPNTSMRIPKLTYYGVEGGWEIKDMSTGVFGSSGGTSHASPLFCGTTALIQSAAMESRGEPLQTEELKMLIQEHSTPPRPTQINQFGFFAGPSGWDARFGWGELDIVSAVEEVMG